MSPAGLAPTLLGTTELVSSSTAKISLPVLALQSPGSGLGFPTRVMSEWDLLMVRFLPAPSVSASFLICNFLSHLALVMGLREGEARWVGSHIPQPSPRRGRGRAHGLLKAGPGGLPCWILEPEQHALGLGTEALQLLGAGRVQSLGWHGWPGGPGRAGRGGGGRGALHLSLPAALVGPAKSWWNQAQVPMCLVTGLLFEKLKWCQDNLTSAFISGAWSRAGGGPSETVCAGRPVGRRPGTEQITAKNIIHPELGSGERQIAGENRKLGPGLTPHQLLRPGGPGQTAGPGPTMCQVLGGERRGEILG